MFKRSMLNYAKNNMLYTEIDRYDDRTVNIRHLWSHKLVARPLIQPGMPTHDAHDVINFIIDKYGPADYD